MEIKPIEWISVLVQSTWYFQAISILFFIALIFGLWKIFEKNNKQGWYSLIPVFNLFFLCKISTKRPILNFVFLLLPIVNIIFWIKINIQLSRKLNKNFITGLMLAIFPYIYYPILGSSQS